MKDLLTVVIPCKNEGLLIYECVRNIYLQENSDGLRVIIADNSDTPLDFFNWFENMNVQVIKGGYPAAARLAGSKLVTTPYMLFLDADVMIKDRSLLSNMMSYLMKNENKELLTVRYETDDKKYNWFFIGSDLLQLFGLAIGTTFAIGGFQLWKKSAYWEYGGYVAEQMVCEDFYLTRHVKMRNFCIYRTRGVFTSARRIEKNGIRYFIWLSFQCYLNRNNPEWFNSTHNYWQ